MQSTKITYPLIAVAVAVAITVFIVSSMPITAPEEASGVWTMRSISYAGRSGLPILNSAFTLSINGTDIQGEICNGFAGEIEYVDTSTIKGRRIFFTAMGCAEHIMETEDAFKDGLTNGMSISESESRLMLRDVVTNTTFTYER